MGTAALTTHQVKDLPLVLVVDKLGVIGEEISRNLSQDFLVVFVSKVKPQENKNIIHIPFSRKIPQVPDNEYSKIFVVDDGYVITRESVFSFVSIARSSSAPIYFIASCRNIDVNHAEEVASEYSKVKVLIFGDLFDREVFFDKNSSVNRYILEARKNKKILVPGNGLALNFPMTLEDTVKLIIKASYLEVDQKILLLFPPSPVTDISLAHVFQKVSPDIIVDFVKSATQRQIYIPNNSEHVIGKYDLEQKIKELGVDQEEERELKVMGGAKKKRNLLKPFLLLLLILLFIILLPFFTTGAYYGLGKYELNAAKNSALSGDFDKSIDQAKKAKTLFQTSQKTSNFLATEASYLGILADSKVLRDKSIEGEDVSDMIRYFALGASNLKMIFQGSSMDPSGDLQKSSEALTSGVSIEDKLKAQGSLPKDYENSIKDLRPIIDLFSNSGNALPEVLGLNGERKYLVLLENNNTLRPGGGEIQGYGLLTLKNGRVTSFKAYDSQELDEKFKDHVEPPFPVRRYLPSSNLYLKDSNFDPDFVKSSIQASRVYNLETKDKVNGVIGVDLDFAKDILGIIGPITLSNSQKIEAQNLFDIVKNSNDPGILSELTSSILAAPSKEELKVFPLLKLLGKSIKEKNLIFAFSNQGAADIFSANGLSGTLLDLRSVKENQINDYLGLSEANLGRNQVNASISRSLSKKTVIDVNGQISSKLQIAFKNNSTKEDYKNYIQLILPTGAQINSILIDNKEVEVNKAVTDYFVYESKGFKAPKGLEINQENSMNKTVFGFLVNIPSGEIKTIAIDYSLSDKVSKSVDKLNYSLKVYKQPGVYPYPFDLTFDLPDNYTIISGKNPLSTELDSDKEFNYIMLRK